MKRGEPAERSHFSTAAYGTSSSLLSGTAFHCGIRPEQGKGKLSKRLAYHFTEIAQLRLHHTISSLMSGDHAQGRHAVACRVRLKRKGGRNLRVLPC